MIITDIKTVVHNLTLFLLLFVVCFSCNDQNQSVRKFQGVMNSMDPSKIEKLKSEDTIKEGAICTVEDGEGKFGIIKVLVIDSEIAHVRIYKNKYSIRPTKIDLKTLSIGSIKDKDGFGIGHIPISRKGFEDWKPVVIANENVSETELEGYKIWKSQ